MEKKVFYLFDVFFVTVSKPEYDQEVDHEYRDDGGKHSGITSQQGTEIVQHSLEVNGVHFGDSHTPGKCIHRGGDFNALANCLTRGRLRTDLQLVKIRLPLHLKACLQ